ncbi:MAG: aminotransferase class V-fold PLP-dependent enzyme, partial [Oligoflexales bacterium]|nr:aminotransferase class V-fold PLP-dependent enzyme [Oligoflexales bacterium]
MFSSSDDMADLSNPLLDLEREKADQWIAAAHKSIAAFLSGMEKRPAYIDAAQKHEALRLTENSEPQPIDSVLETFFQEIKLDGIMTAAGGHMGYIPGGGLMAGALADYIGAAVNLFTGDSASAPAAAKIHAETINWLLGIVGFGPEAFGDITSGGSLAALTALVAARQAFSESFAVPGKVAVYVGQHVHHSFQKALGIAAYGKVQLRVVPSGREFRIDLQSLDDLSRRDVAAGITPWIAVASAGTTSLGTIDNLEGISEICRRRGMWLHIDAAYGGFFMLVPSLRGKFAGIDRADSIVMDPHKGLFLPYGCGALLVKDKYNLRRSLKATASYLQDSKESGLPSPMDYSLELTRPFRSLRLYLTLKLHGEESLRQAIWQKHRLAEYLYGRICDIAGLRLMGKPDLSIVAFF